MVQAQHYNASRIPSVTEGKFMQEFSGRELTAILLGILLAGPAVAQDTVPLRTRNLSPMVAIFGLPTWETGLEGRSQELAVVAEVANHYRLSSRGQEQLILDGETWRTSFFYKRSLAERWTFGVEVSLLRHSGGVLDDVIDGWHSLFNLPDGSRNRLPEDQFDFLYNDGGVNAFTLSESRTGLGDTQISLSRMVGGDSGVLLRAIVKLPTGDADTLAGSGAADLSITLLRRSQMSWGSHPIGTYWGLGVMRVGTPEYLATRSEDWVGLGVLGGSWQPFEKIGLKVQLDYHTRFYNSSLVELGSDSVQASIGGWWALDDRRTLSFALNEDLTVRTSPDVSLHLDFSWRLGASPL